MALSFKEIALQFAVRGEGDDHSIVEMIDLRGHRCEAIIENAGGNLSLGRMQLRIYGMSAADMNRLSTSHLMPMEVRGDAISLSAGSSDKGLAKVFDGTVLSACVNYQGMPDVAFDIYAQVGFLYQAKPAASNSYQGAADAVVIIESLAKQMGFAFKNNGVNAVLVDQYLSGDLIQQLRTVTEAARIPCSIENGVVTIWPNDQGTDDSALEISPSTGMVGYPTFTRAGILVTTEFRPEVTLGRKINVQTSVEKARGEWRVQNTRHELSTLIPQGPWFTSMNLSKPGFYVNRN